jgi:hypothetical protein
VDADTVRSTGDLIKELDTSRHGSGTDGELVCEEVRKAGPCLAYRDAEVLERVDDERDERAVLGAACRTFEVRK